jgi:hypothetical protein
MLSQMLNTINTISLRSVSQQPPSRVLREESESEERAKTMVKPRGPTPAGAFKPPVFTKKRESPKKDPVITNDN